MRWLPDALRRGPTALTAAGRSASLERLGAVRLTDWVPAEMLSTIDGERKARGRMRLTSESSIFSGGAIHEAEI